MRRALPVAAVFAAVLVLAPAGFAATEPSWRAHTIARGGSISLPSTWRNFTRPTRQLHASLQREVERNPRIAPLLYALTARTSPLVRFVGADLAQPSLRRGVVTTVNVLSQRTSGTLDRWAATNVAALRGSRNVVKPIRRSTILLPAGRAVQLRYVQRLPAGSPVRRVSMTQYAVARNGVISLLTFTTVPREVSRLSPVFQRSARSLRLR